MKAVAIVFGLLGLAAGAGWSTAAEESLARPLDCEVVLGRSGDADKVSIVLLNLRNVGSECTIDSVSVRVESVHGVVGSVFIDSLQAKQCEGRYMLVGRRTDGVWARVEFRIGSRHCSIVRVASVAGDGSSERGGGGTGAVVGLVGVVLGALLVHVFTSLRDHDQRRAERRRIVFEGSEAAFRAFLSGWRSSISGGVLRAQFEALRLAAVVPPEMQRKYDTTQVVLDDGRASREQKEDAARSLSEAVTRFMMEP
jgi:hypothetical protein